MSELIHLQPQPEFPYEDISEDNAALLELMLANPDILESCHQAAEAVSFFYKTNHRAVSRIIENRLADDTKEAAFSHGQSTWEALSAMIKPDEIAGHQHNGLEVNLHILQAQRSLDEAFIDTIDEARDRLHNDMPRGEVIVIESARRFYPHVTDYALCGAALARQAELRLNAS